MKFSFAAVASLLISTAYSQTISSEVAQIPSCALSCLTSAITGAGCGVSDYACQCGSAKSSITTAATPCVLSSCSTSDALKLESITSEICTIQAASGSGGGGGASSVAPTAAPATTQTAATSSSSNVSNISNIGFTTSKSTVTKATSAAGGVTTSSASKSSSTSSPSQVSSSPGNRLQAGGIAVVAALIALAL